MFHLLVVSLASWYLSHVKVLQTPTQKKHHSITNNLFVRSSTFLVVVFHHVYLPVWFSASPSVFRAVEWMIRFQYYEMKKTHYTQSRLPLPPYCVSCMLLSLSNIHLLSHSSCLRFGMLNNNLFASIFQSILSFISICSPGKKEGSKTLFAGSFVLNDRKNHFKWLAVSTWMVGLRFRLSYSFLVWLKLNEWNSWAVVIFFFFTFFLSLSFWFCCYSIQSTRADWLIWFDGWLVLLHSHLPRDEGFYVFHMILFGWVLCNFRMVYFVRFRS